MSCLLALLLAVLLATGCSAQADPAAPAGPDGSGAASTVAAYRVDRVTALRALESLLPRGFELVLTCPSRRPPPCRVPGTEGSRWLVATRLQGGSLPDGDGPAELVRAVVTAWPSTGAAASYAGRLTQRLSHCVSPCRGELHPVTHGDWRGTVLRRLADAAAGGHAVLRRGRYVADLEWLARSQAVDRRLSHLPRRLLRSLS